MAEKMVSVDAADRRICRVGRDRQLAEEKVRFVLDRPHGKTDIAASCRRDGTTIFQTPPLPFARSLDVTSDGLSNIE